MNKRDFLKASGLFGIASLTPMSKLLASQPAAVSCVLIPSETAGPFPLDLTANTAFFRQDVRETEEGVPLHLRMRIIGTQNCEPMPNVRVNIWHCDKDGNYSGYDGEINKTYLRGYQMTNANGEVDFITIFPGWYPGRTCHIHFQVYVNSNYAAISQLGWEDSAKNELLASHASIYTKGTDPVSIGSDGVFANGYQYQLATLTPNTTGGYDSFLEVAVQGAGTSGVGYAERENAKQFVLGQNFPNPYVNTTTIPLTLHQNSNVRIDLWDVMGRKVATVLDRNLSAGEHPIAVDLRSLGLPLGNYAYQLEVRNASGTYKDCKLMTALSSR